MVMDLDPPVINPGLFRYRTFVRISFDGENRRSNPELCWKLWKERRDATEAQRACKFSAFELAANDKDYRHMQLERVLIDGFCVTWNAE